MSSIQRFPDNQSRADYLDELSREHALSQHCGPDGQGIADPIGSGGNSGQHPEAP